MLCFCKKKLRLLIYDIWPTKTKIIVQIKPLHIIFKMSYLHLKKVKCGNYSHALLYFDNMFDIHLYGRNGSDVLHMKILYQNEWLKIFLSEARYAVRIWLFLELLIQTHVICHREFGIFQLIETSVVKQHKGSLSIWLSACYWVKIVWSIIGKA